MKFKKVALGLALLPMIFSAKVFSLEITDYFKGLVVDVYSMQSGNKRYYQRLLFPPHIPQPTQYTCGAAALSMWFSWEQAKRNVDGNVTLLDTLTIYGMLNDSGGNSQTEASGLNTVEIKDNIIHFKNLLNFLMYLDNIHNPNSFYRFIENFATVEKGYDSIVAAIAGSYFGTWWNASPQLLYGNVEGIYAANFRRGGHYYLTAGTMYCDTTLCGGGGEYGLYIMDPVYQSPAYSLISGIPEGEYLSSDELDGFTGIWQPTGAGILGNFFNGKHLFLANTAQDSMNGTDYRAQLQPL